MWITVWTLYSLFCHKPLKTQNGVEYTPYSYPITCKVFGVGLDDL